MNEKNFWNKLADRYDASVQKTYADAYRDTVSLTRRYLKKESRLLDYGCGTGIITNQIASDVQGITAIDISDQMIRNAAGKAEELKITNIDYLTAGLSDERIRSGSYDTITAFNVLYFVKDVKTLLRRFYDMLPDGGLFLSVTDCLGGKRSVKRGLTRLLMNFGFLPYMKDFTMEELTGIIQKAGFTILETKNLFDEPPNLYVAAKKES
ncbi:MAG: class I SAM-dependent methyltransferase [Spirochaetales bacterium]|nr:class I SAM-dependent methyltransferase [Spirochaetales bacterium]